MTTINVTYRAPLDDNPVVTTGGVRFFDGQAVPLEGGEHSALLRKLGTNQHFELDGELPAEADHNGDKLEAVHNGGGRYIIVRGGDKAAPVKTGLDKADAAAFNALSDEDKAAYVAD
jgi:hypothetical protein